MKLLARVKTEVLTLRSNKTTQNAKAKLEMMLKVKNRKKNRLLSFEKVKTRKIKLKEVKDKR